MKVSTNKLQQCYQCIDGTADGATDGAEHAEETVVPLDVATTALVLMETLLLLECRVAVRSVLDGASSAATMKSTVLPSQQQ